MRGRGRKPPPPFTQGLGLSKKAGLLSSQPHTQLPSVTSRQGTDQLLARGVPASCVETSSLSSQPTFHSRCAPCPSAAVEGEEKEERCPLVAVDSRSTSLKGWAGLGLGLGAPPWLLSLSLCSGPSGPLSSGDPPPSCLPAAPHPCIMSEAP